MSGKRAGTTAGELLAQQATDTEYQEMRRKRDRELLCIAEGRKREQQPLLNDLAEAGAVVDWVGRLLEMPALDERIYSVLLDHLARPYTPWLLEWIGRAFGSRTARPIAWDALIDLLKCHALGESATEGVFAAISAMARPEDLHALIDLLSDPSLGRGRIYLIGNLMRSRKQEARAALLRHQVDPDLAMEITARLSRAQAKVR